MERSCRLCTPHPHPAKRGRGHSAWEFLPYRPAKSLADHIGQFPHVPLTTRELIQVIGGVNAALSALHTPTTDEHMYLVHRDLKPSNILIRQLDPLEVELSDTEMTQLVGPLLPDHPTVAGGTAAYMSPEADVRVQPAGDYWSLGMTLALLGTGRHPDQLSNGSFQSADAIVGEHRERLPQIPPGLDSRLHHLVRGLITRDSNYRFGTEQVAQVLEGQLPPLPPEHQTQSAPFAPTAAATSGPATATSPGDNGPATETPPQHGQQGGPNSNTPPVFIFDQSAHTRPETLAAALAGNWTLAAQTLIGQPRTILAWLAIVDPDRASAVAPLLEAFIRRETTVHRAIAETIHALDPTIAPSIRGLVIDEPNLRRIAEWALSGDRNALTAINDLAEGHVLEVLARHRGHGGLEPVATQWQQHLTTAHRLLDDSLPERHPGQRDPLAAILLSAIVDRREADRLIARAEAYASEPRTREIPWFATLIETTAPRLPRAAAITIAYELAPYLPITVRPELDAFARGYLRAALERRAPPATPRQVTRQTPSAALAVATLVILIANLWSVLHPSVLAFLAVGTLTAVVAGAVAFQSRHTPLGVTLITASVWGGVVTLLGVTTALMISTVWPPATAAVLAVCWVLWAGANLAAMATNRTPPRPQRLSRRLTGRTPRGSAPYRQYSAQSRHPRTSGQR